MNPARGGRPALGPADLAPRTLALVVTLGRCVHGCGKASCSRERFPKTRIFGNRRATGGTAPSLGGSAGGDGPGKFSGTRPQRARPPCRPRPGRGDVPGPPAPRRVRRGHPARLSAGARRVAAVRGRSRSLPARQARTGHATAPLRRACRLRPVGRHREPAHLASLGGCAVAASAAAPAARRPGRRAGTARAEAAQRLDCGCATLLRLLSVTALQVPS